MSVSYDLFTGAFLGKVTEYDFLHLDEYDRNNMVDGYMKRACSQFDKVCIYDLTDHDDIIRQFNIDIPDNEIDEILDIVSEGMLVQWMKQYVYKQDNLVQLLNTKDFTNYSPAELFRQVNSAYNSVAKRFTNMIREYSYNHGDLTELHL